MERLLRLAADASLREELTAFPLSPTADAAIQPEHRAGELNLTFQFLCPILFSAIGSVRCNGVILEQLCPEHHKTPTMQHLVAFPFPTFLPRSSIYKMINIPESTSDY